MARRKAVKESSPEAPFSNQTHLRRFVLVRTEDVSGTSGTGIVAEGVRLSSGQAVLHWLSQFSSVAIYHSTDVMMNIHGHLGRTVLQWVDETQPGQD